ncbi:Cation diffusion facilitator family transporter [Carboxydothermus islandicus]|uniref:Cation diffusion facilitator family transporter n=1 Tax=Carboxydothermus islandicus TaxID=661089 RepID=A0A1L8D064_9THEO|nr:cation diffusion facilitator family transporter [Carboxydothermus islandicus]GAV24586.1 Cation diffusion facilitator family transporter [Carboxydothermus islandicus]
MAHQDHRHNHQTIDKGNLFLTIILNFLITVTEILGGIYANSLSLLSDALHNFSDGLALIVSYFALKIAQKGSDEKRTFGYKRSTILAAVVNSSVLIILSGLLLREAYKKFLNPEPIAGKVMIFVALIGLVANTLGMALLNRGAEKDLNIKSAYLHLFSDALASVAVIFGGIIIYYYNIYWVDPALTVIVGIYVLKESFDILKKATNILMQGVPEGIDVMAIVQKLKGIKEIQDVHHVHLWSLNENNLFFEAHVNLREDLLLSQTNSVYERIKHVLNEHFGINHLTIQFEYNCCPEADIIQKE